MKKNILAISILIILVSCNKKAITELPIKSENDTVAVEQKNDIEKMLTEKYSIVYKLDTLDYIYSTDFDSVVQSSFQLIDDFYLMDIFRIDTAIYAQIKVSRPTRMTLSHLSTPLNNSTLKKQDLILTCPISKIQEVALRNFLNGYLVVSIDNIRKNIIMIEAEVEFEGEDPYYYIQTDGGFSGTGKIVEIAPS